MDLKTKLRRSLNAVEAALSSLKRTRGLSAGVDDEIEKAIRELKDAEHNIRKAISEI